MYKIIYKYFYLFFIFMQIFLQYLFRNLNDNDQVKIATNSWKGSRVIMIYITVKILSFIFWRLSQGWQRKPVSRIILQPSLSQLTNCRTLGSVGMRFDSKRWQALLYVTSLDDKAIEPAFMKSKNHPVCRTLWQCWYSCFLYIKWNLMRTFTCRNVIW